MLLMAARGHAGLPPTISHAPAPQQAPAAPGGSDAQVASNAAQELTQAIQQARDPQLKAALAAALTALHKYVAADQKETHAAMGGKLSPRLMAQAHAGQ